MYTRHIHVFIISLTFAFTWLPAAVQLYHRPLKRSEHKKTILIWQERDTRSFDTILISWESSRPQQGAYRIQARVHGNGVWSDWVDYAWWGVADQHMFNFQFGKGMATFLQGSEADGFAVRVYAENGANLSAFRELHASVMLSAQHTVNAAQKRWEAIQLPVVGISQIAIPDERNTKICSPTSMTAVIRYAQESNTVDPLAFAETVRDTRLHIYGAWVLNVAQAAHELGAGWHTYVTHLSGIDQLVSWIHKGFPVVVSIQGPIAGGARPYESGHLLVVKGYNPLEKRVLCMDPGFPDDQSTHVSYAEDDFLCAWRRRNGLAYITYKK